MKKLVELLTDRQQHPAMEPDVFGGDVIQFPVWLRSFEAIIENTTSSERDKLYFLHKYTGGEARKTIHRFMILDEQDTYAKAKQARIRRFGDKYKTYEAFKDELHRWPVVEDRKGLQQFSDFLQQCSAAVKSVHYL